MTFRVDLATVNGDMLKSFIWETDRYDRETRDIPLDTWWRIEGQMPVGAGVPLSISLRRIL